MKDADHFANLQYLAIEWGLHSSWDSLDGSRAGVRFIRNFPRLRKLTLLVKFLVINELPQGEPRRRHREQTQKRRALRAILNDVYHAIDVSKDERPMTDEGELWTEPEVRIVPKTRAWTPPRVKAWRPLPVTWVEPERTVVVRIDGQKGLGSRIWTCGSVRGIIRIPQAVFVDATRRGFWRAATTTQGTRDANYYDSHEDIILMNCLHVSIHRVYYASRHWNRDKKASQRFWHFRKLISGMIQ